MSEHPEQMLPQQRVSALRNRVEVRAEEPVELQEHERDGDDRECERHQELHDERHPRENRHAHERHAGRAQIDDGRDEVERGRERRDTKDLETKHPEIHVVLRRVRLRAQRRVTEPSAVWRHAEEDWRRDEQSAKQIDPVAERVEARERHVARADLQRNEKVEKRRRHGHDGEEDHGRAMHREQLIVHLGRYNVAVRSNELETKHCGFKTAEDEEDQRGNEVELPDSLVIDRRQPTPDTLGGVLRRCCSGVMGRCDCGCHRWECSPFRLLEEPQIRHDVGDLRIGVHGHVSHRLTTGRDRSGLCP